MRVALRQKRMCVCVPTVGRNPPRCHVHCADTVFAFEKEGRVRWGRVGVGVGGAVAAAAGGVVAAVSSCVSCGACDYSLCS